MVSFDNTTLPNWDLIIHWDRFTDPSECSRASQIRCKDTDFFWYMQE